MPIGEQRRDFVFVGDLARINMFSPDFCPIKNLPKTYRRSSMPVRGSTHIQSRC